MIHRGEPKSNKAAVDQLVTHTSLVDDFQQGSGSGGKKPYQGRITLVPCEAVSVPSFIFVEVSPTFTRVA